VLLWRGVSDAGELVKGCRLDDMVSDERHPSAIFPKRHLLPARVMMRTTVDDDSNRSPTTCLDRVDGY
jgi:hypothetical protein